MDCQIRTRLAPRMIPKCDQLGAMMPKLGPGLPRKSCLFCVWCGLWTTGRRGRQMHFQITVHYIWKFWYLALRASTGSTPTLSHSLTQSYNALPTEHQKWNWCPYRTNPPVSEKTCKPLICREPYIYIYIYRERERESYIYIYIYII